MNPDKKKVSILISTKNRLQVLQFTLLKISHIIKRNDVECIIYDDGSTDGTSQYISEHYPGIVLYTNRISKGYLFCRNKMLNTTRADFAISLDDDAHFVTNDPLEIIIDFFDKNSHVGLLGFRVYWSKKESFNSISNESAIRMQSFVGCGHVWRMTAWRDIADYPEWFIFYGEENFASYELYKKKWEIYYLPQVLVQHRVDIKERKTHKDAGLRLRRSLCSGWSLYFLFLPLKKIPRLMAYSIWMQLKLKVFKGEMTALKPIFLGLLDLTLKMPKNLKHRNALTKKEDIAYRTLEKTKIYWQPE